MFEIVDGRTPEHGYTISSPCSGELIIYESCVRNHALCIYMPKTEVQVSSATVQADQAGLKTEFLVSKSEILSVYVSLDSIAWFVSDLSRRQIF